MSGQSKTQVIFDPKPFAIDGSWAMRFTRPDGSNDYVSGFTSQEHAETWVKGAGCEAWLNARGHTKG
jgi:hypothetical protein